MTSPTAPRGGWWDTARNPRSLGARLVLILTAVGVAGALGITLLLASVITPSFSQLERRSVESHVERTRAILADYRRQVQSAVEDNADRAAADDDIVARARPSLLTVAKLGGGGMAVVGPDGRIDTARWIDRSGRDRPTMRVRLLAGVGALDLPHLLRARKSTSVFAALGPVVAAIGVAEIRRGDFAGAPRGYLLMARTLTSAQLSALLRLRAAVGPATADAAMTRTGHARVTIAVPIVGADGSAVASARFSVPREVSVLGRRMLLLAISGSILLLLIVLVVLRRVIARLVLRPLGRIEAHMGVVRASGALTPLAEERRRDEIGSLGRSFNAMLRQLRDLREQLQAQSFALGRSESAVAVMHNVRNALNPISTILSQGAAQTVPVDRETVSRALAELAAADVAEARRRKLAAFVGAAIEAGEGARAEHLRRLAIGREALRHVLDIIGDQQALANERPVPEICDATDIVAQNAAIARYSGGVSIAFSFPARSWPVLANRMILSQVIGNLFANAAEAIAAGGRDGGSIAVTIHGGEAVTIRIRDDGEGFPPAAGATLFRRGFSTRGHKSGGLGLHWCANAVSAMDGTLRLESEGPGRGAVAVLTLSAPEAAAQAA